MVMGREPTPYTITLVYKTVYASHSSSEGGLSGIPLQLDVYLPDSRSSGTPAFEDNGVGFPAVVYFHGGGLLVGNRRSWFPDWLQSEFTLGSIDLASSSEQGQLILLTGRLSAQGVAFLSADYRLLSPTTGHDILEDIQDLFAYIRKDLNPALSEVTGNSGSRVNVDAIAIAGTSAGGLCAYLCAIHLSPKPRALLSMYGQAGECLVRISRA